VCSIDKREKLTVPRQRPRFQIWDRGFSMGKYTETVITVCYNHRSASTDVWVTQRESGPQFELLGMAFDAPDAIVKRLNDVVSQVLKSG
jgi:frataxin-like iron-binding protein CyaY